MNITLIHGEDTNSSYKRFMHIIDVIKKRGWSVNYLTDKTITLEEFLRSSSLFSENDLYVIEGVSKLSKKDLEWIAKNGSDYKNNFLIYETKNVDKRIEKALGNKIKVEKFDLPKTIFVFLDSLIPGNAKKSLQLFHELIKNEAVELVMAMICSLYRDLYWVSVSPQTMKLPSWRAQKLKKQSDAYTKDELVKIIDNLAKIDIEVKTSVSNLQKELDLFIASLDY